MENKKNELVEFTDVTKLREIATGENGQYIKLVDIDEVKTKLQGLADKYKGLKITKENYKKEGTLAEKTLRQSRYALQRIHKSNNNFINAVKKNEKELYDGLINLIKPQEERIQKEVSAFKTIEKEEKEKKEREEKIRIEKIESTLKEAEFSLEKAVISGKTNEDLERYDKFLNDLKDEFKNFEEFEFQAKRLHAIYTARRGELEAQILEFKRVEKERKEQEEKEKKRKEQEEKILEMRKKALIKKGFKLSDSNIKLKDVLKYSNKFIKALDEVEWFELLETIDGKIQEIKNEEERKEKERKEQEDKEKKDTLIKARKDWDDLVVVYKGLGGDPKIWKLSKNEMPSVKDVQKLAKATRDLQAQKKTLKLKSVQKDLITFKNDIDANIKELDNKISNTKFNNSESEDILENFVKEYKKLFNEVFKEV